MAEEVGGEGKEDTNVTVNCVHVIVHVRIYMLYMYIHVLCIYIYTWMTEKGLYSGTSSSGHHEKDTSINTRD